MKAAVRTAKNPTAARKKNILRTKAIQRKAVVKKDQMDHQSPTAVRKRKIQIFLTAVEVNIESRSK